MAALTEPLIVAGPTPWVKIVVQGDPVPWGVGRNPKTGDRYVPGRQSQQRGNIMDAWYRQVPAQGSLSGDVPVELELRFYIGRPKYHFGTGKNAGVIKERYRYAFPTGRPDLTNLQKLCEDALTGVAWKDDDQVVAVDARKVFTDEPARTEIRLRFLPS